jgi:hypothetical protein
MWSSKAFLKHCEKLKEAGLAIQFEPGVRIARGFADLGYEEFYALSGGKAVSVFSGQVAQIPPEHQKFFFLVPSFDRLINEIQRAGFDVECLEFENQRTWVLSVKEPQGGTARAFRSAEVLCALAEALQFALGISEP